MVGTSFSVLGGEQSPRSSPLLMGVRLLSARPPSSLLSLVPSWSWMYASCSIPGLLRDLRVSRELPCPLPVSENDSATWLPGFRDINTGPGGQNVRPKKMSFHTVLQQAETWTGPTTLQTYTNAHCSNKHISLLTFVDATEPLLCS